MAPTESKERQPGFCISFLLKKKQKLVKKIPNNIIFFNLSPHATYWENRSKIKKRPKISLRPFLHGCLHYCSICDGKFLSKFLSPQNNFVAATRLNLSDLLQGQKSSAATKIERTVL